MLYYYVSVYYGILYYAIMLLCYIMLYSASNAQAPAPDVSVPAAAAVAALTLSFVVCLNKTMQAYVTNMCFVTIMYTHNKCFMKRVTNNKSHQSIAFIFRSQP